MRSAVIIAATLAFVAPAPAEPHAKPAKGSLLIVGGGLRDDNDAVFAAFLRAMPDRAGKIVIIPAGSGIPAEAAGAFAQNLVRRGVAAEDISVARIAMIDDPATSEDESQWRGNAESDIEVARVKAAAAIWFTGGDQSRIVASLYRPDGSDTPVLAAIRERLALGAVVGGTSAGAAIMSDPMIMQGDSAAALTRDFTRGEPLEVGRGLGFWPKVLVDQHFGERARLGRLVMALSATAKNAHVGVGIDEDTAVLVRSGGQRADVVGRGYVTVIAIADPARTSRPAGNGVLFRAGNGFDIDRRPRNKPLSRFARSIPCTRVQPQADERESAAIAAALAQSHAHPSICLGSEGHTSGPYLQVMPRRTLGTANGHVTLPQAFVFTVANGPDLISE